MVQGFALVTLNDGTPELQIQVASIVARQSLERYPGRPLDWIRPARSPWVRLNLDDQRRDVDGNTSKPVQEVKTAERTSWQGSVSSCRLSRVFSRAG
jgi:hypothetical protein